MMSDMSDVADINDRAEIKRYICFLMDYNQKVNLVSRKISPGGLAQLIAETALLNEYISRESSLIVDAGSGGGILGIPLALLNTSKPVVLVEPKKKKVEFLREAKEILSLENVEIYGVSIDEYINKEYKEAGMKGAATLVARGFPHLGVFVDYVYQGLLMEAVLVTSENKIKKNQKHMETIRKKIYNVPLRTHLKILKMEKIARE